VDVAVIVTDGGAGNGIGLNGSSAVPEEFLSGLILESLDKGATGVTMIVGVPTALLHATSDDVVGGKFEGGFGPRGGSAATELFPTGSLLGSLAGGTTVVVVIGVRMLLVVA